MQEPMCDVWGVAIDCSSSVETAVQYAELNADEERRVYVLEGVLDPQQELRWGMDRSAAVGPSLPETSHFSVGPGIAGEGQVTVFHADL